MFLEECVLRYVRQTLLSADMSHKTGSSKGKIIHHYCSYADCPLSKPKHELGNFNNIFCSIQTFQHTKLLIFQNIPCKQMILKFLCMSIIIKQLFQQSLTQTHRHLCIWQNGNVACILDQLSCNTQLYNLSQFLNTLRKGFYKS